MNCIICYERITTKVVVCPICHNVAHKECWNMMEDKLHCPYCRNAICDRERSRTAEYARNE